MPLKELVLLHWILLFAVLLAGCIPGTFTYPYVRTEGLVAACNGDAFEDAGTRHVADTICYSYLSAVIDSLAAQRYRVKVPDVCMPDSGELLEQYAEVDFAVEEKRPATNEEKAAAVKKLQEDLAEEGGSLPFMYEILFLYRAYTDEDSVLPSAYTDNWRIGLHRTPFETVTSALHEAWPCENYNSERHGYHVINKIINKGAP